MRLQGVEALGFCVVLGLLGVTSPARADEASAAETFRAGTAAYARGEYRAAALAFEAAFHEQPHAAALYNAGRSWAAAGAQPRAADAYAAALRASGLDSAQEADSRARLQELEASLGSVLVTAPSGALVSLEHVERAPAPVLVHVTSGDHTAKSVLPGGQAISRTVHVNAGERVTLAFDAPTLPAGKAAPSRRCAAHVDQRHLGRRGRARRGRRRAARDVEPRGSPGDTPCLAERRCPVRIVLSGSRRRSKRSLYNQEYLRGRALQPRKCQLRMEQPLVVSYRLSEHRRVDS